MTVVITCSTRIITIFGLGIPGLLGIFDVPNSWAVVL